MGQVFILISPVIGSCDPTDITGIICSLSVVLLTGEFPYHGNLILIHTDISMLNNAVLHLFMSLL